MVRAHSRKNFMETREAGVNMEMIGVAVSDALSDLILPTACNFANNMVVARVPLEYVSIGDSARTYWLCDLQRQGRLG